MIHSVAAAVGLSSILATSATAFTVIKLAGAMYLVALGVQALVSPSEPAAGPATLAPRSAWRLVVEALATGLLNPKVALFFLAFLPQFVDPTRGMVVGQFLTLGLTVAGVGLCFDSLLAILVSRARAAGSPAWARWRQRIVGGMFIGLGLRLALERRP